jgi:hypothetical protein
MPKKDLNQIAFDVVRLATGDTVPPVESAKAKAGRKGGIKGGQARAAALSSKRRRQIAKTAAAARWKQKP